MNAKVRGITGDVLANQEVQAVLKQDHALLEALKKTVEDGLVEKREVDDLAKLLDKSGIQGELSKEVSEVDMSGMVDQALDKVKFTEGVGNVQKLLRIAMAAVLLMLPVSAFAGENPKNVNKPRAKVEKLKQGLSLKGYVRDGKDLTITDFGEFSREEVQEALDELQITGGFLKFFSDGKGILFTNYGGKVLYDGVTFKGDWQKELVYKLVFLLRNQRRDPRVLNQTFPDWEGKQWLESDGGSAKKQKQKEAKEAMKRKIPVIKFEKNPKTEADFLALHNQMKGILDKLLKGVDVNKIKNDPAYVDFNKTMEFIMTAKLQNYLLKADEHQLKYMENQINKKIKDLYNLTT
ncbi:MAG: hypothetical protein KKC46_12325 [Proteobacteria bacterium]|nr:hypothetical protein [Pseudomonadota bacterium]